MLKFVKKTVVSSVLFGVVGGSAMLLPACGSTQVREDQSQWAGAMEGKGALLTVEGLGCPMCAESIHVLLDGVDGVSDSHVNLETGVVTVDFEPGATVSKSALASAVTDGGFSLRNIQPMGE